MAGNPEEWEEKKTEIVQILETISNQVGTPRNIRRTAKAASEVLFDEKISPGIRAANAISQIEDILQDPNMPQFTRVQLYRAITLLETLRA